MFEPLNYSHQDVM